MRKLDSRTMKAIFALQDLRDICNQGRDLVDSYCSVSYVGILDAYRKGATTERIYSCVKKIEKAICLLGDYISRKEFAVKYYDLSTIERFNRISDYIQELNDPVYIKLNQRLQHLITKYNKFSSYSEDYKQKYNNISHSNIDRIRLFDLYLDFSQGRVNLDNLSTTDLEAIEHLQNEEIEMTQKVIEKYDLAISKVRRQIEQLI